MPQTEQKYPIGLQTFSEVRNRGCVYVDKTEYIWRLLQGGMKYYFLGRPRRFGKSLLVSTMHSYFAGRRELFKGLYIDTVEKEWAECPVLHFDMSGGKHLREDALTRFLLDQLQPYEQQYGIDTGSPDTNIRLKNLIRTACQRTGRQVVVLVDEYDAPLLDVVHLSGEMDSLRYTMRNFYSPLKGCDPYLKFVFLTGITKFAQMSIFSELNNLTNISMDEDFAAICGITQEEMEQMLKPGIVRLAQAQGWSVEKTTGELKRMYDGYHFARVSPDVYNPYSLLNALYNKRMGYYWFESGTPTFIVELLRKHRVPPSRLGGQKVAETAFNVSPESRRSIVPLLYQSGYLTIKNFVPPTIYTLDVPNEEVRLGLMNNLVGYYVPEEWWDCNQYVLQDVGGMMNDGDVDGAMRLLQTFFASIPYTHGASSEGHYQQLLYVVFTLLGYYVDVEVHTSAGRVDLVIRTSTRLYLIETKLDRSAAAAMEQINLRHYADRFALCGLPITKVGVSFDSSTRTISRWEVEE